MIMNYISKKNRRRSNANVETILHIISSEEPTENELGFYIEVLAAILEHNFL